MKMKTNTRPPVPRRAPRRMVKTLHARAATSDQDFEEFEGESEPNMKFSHALVVVLVLHILAVGGVFAFNSLKSRHIVPDRAKPAPAAQAAANPEAVTPADADKKAVADAKPRQGTAIPAAAEKTTAKPQPADTVSQNYTVAPGDTLTRIANAHKSSVEAIEQANGLTGNASLRVGQVLKIPTKAPAKTESAAAKAPSAKPAPPATQKTAETKPQPVEKAPESKAPAPAKAAATPVAKSASTPAATAAADAPKEDAKPAASEKSYTVAKGDNPYAIAKKLKVSYNDLIKANNITDPTKLQIGQKLIVP